MLWVKHFYKIIITIFTVLVLTGAASAAEDFNIISALSDGVAQGFNKILFSVTDQLYDLAGINSTAAVTNMGNIIIQPNDFLGNKFVQSEKDFTAFWYVILYVVFLLVGGILLFKEDATRQGMGIDETTWRNRYITIAIVAPMIWAFYLFGFKWIFSFEYLLSRSAFLELTDFMPLNSENAIAYFFIGLMILLNILFFYIRYLVVGLIAGWFLFIIIALFFPPTRIYGKLLINYGALMLFSRFVLVLIFIGGFGFFGGSPYIPKHISGALVLIVALLFEVACILYPIIYVIAHSPIKYIKVRR